MDTQRKGSVTDASANEIASRATWFVTRVDSGAHADKRTAQRFGVSVSMAKLLRRGQGWTLARVEQARRSFGPSFDHMVFGPLTAGGQDDISHHVAEFDAAYERLKRCVVGGPYQPRLDAVAPRDTAEASGRELPRPLNGIPVVSRSDERSGDVAERVKEAAE